MLARRIIPCLDVDRGRVVKGVRFVALRDAGDPVECAARYDSEGADELVLLDITASSDARPILIDVVRRVADAVYLPFTVGGGVRSVEDADALLRAGADKVAVNTAAVDDPALLTRLSKRFGAQAIVLAIDARRSTGNAELQENAVGGRGGGEVEGSEASLDPACTTRRASVAPEGPGGAKPPSLNDASQPVGSVSPQGQPLTVSSSAASDASRPMGYVPRFQVFIHGERTPTAKDAVAWAREGAERGVGEILLTSMDRDGTQDGFDVALTRAVAEAVRVPVIASGGCGTVAHMAEAFGAGRAAAALAASIFHFGLIRIPEAKARLRAAGIEVRL
jgi:cyclase